MWLLHTVILLNMFTLRREEKKIWTAHCSLKEWKTVFWAKNGSNAGTWSYRWQRTGVTKRQQTGAYTIAGDWVNGMARNMSGTRISSQELDTAQWRGAGVGGAGGLEMTVKMKAANTALASRSWTWNGSGSALGWIHVTHPSRRVPSELRPTEAEGKSLGTAKRERANQRQTVEFKRQQQKDATASTRLMKKQLHRQKQRKAEDQSPVKFDRRAENSSDFLFARNIQNTTKQKEGRVLLAET